jgi:malonyl-CoA O-methyltransferase
MTDTFPARYAEVAVVSSEVGEQMLGRLDFMTLQPKVIVDLGCGVGYCAELLKKRYPDADVFAVDYAENMIAYGAKHHTADITWICAKEEILPLKDLSVDLIFMNLLLPWCDDIKSIFRECRRILKPEGLLMLSSLGPDTLQELRENFSNNILPALIDMHHIGDELTQARFANPVLDVEYLTVTYTDFEKLLSELQVTGMLIGGISSAQRKIHEDVSGAIYYLSFEVIYSHAWGPNLMVDQVADEQGVVKVPLSRVGKK